MQSEKQVKLGLVGTGIWGRNYLPATAAADGVEIIAVASPNVADKDLFDKDLASEPSRHSDWRALLDIGLDGLIVATPPDSHAQITTAALNAGLAVLVEKPVTLVVAEARALLDLAVTRHAILHVGHIDLHNPAFVAVLAALPDNPDIQRIAGGWSNAGPWRADAQPLWDWGPHPLACLFRVAGLGVKDLQVGVTKVGEGLLYRVQGRIGDIEFDLGFGNGNSHRERWMDVTASGRAYRYDDDASVRATLDGTVLAYETTSPLTAQVARFASAIRRGQADTSDAVLAVEVVRLLQQIEEMTAS